MNSHDMHNTHVIISIPEAVQQQNRKSSVWYSGGVLGWVRSWWELLLASLIVAVHMHCISCATKQIGIQLVCEICLVLAGSMQ